MSSIRPIYSYLLLLLSLFILGNALPTTSNSLDIRDPGIMEIYYPHIDTNSLEVRTGWTAYMNAYPLTAMATIMTPTCLYINIYACYAVFGLTATISLTYIGYTLWMFITNELRKEMMEMRKLPIEIQELELKVSTLAIDLKEKKAANEHNELLRKLWQDARSWEDKWKPKLQMYADMMASFPENGMHELIEEAKALTELVITASTIYADTGRLDTVSLQAFKSGTEGVLSKDDLETLRSEAEKAHKAIENRAKEVIQDGIRYEQIFTRDDLEIGVGRRSLDSELPILIKEFNENCDIQHCHRMWFSSQAPTQQNQKRRISKADIFNSNVIHNIYSTPVDYEFTSSNTLARREIDDTQDCTETVEVKGHKYLFRMAAISGGDSQSLLKINLMNNKQSSEFRKQLTEKNLNDFTKGEWMCMNTDTDNGGDPAMVAVGIFTTEESKLHEDPTKYLEKCKK